MRNTWQLALPVIAAQLGMMAMGLVDTVMVGPLGAEALAATSVANAVFFCVAIFFMGTLTILDAMVSQSVGAGQLRRCGSLLWRGLYAGIVFGVPLNVLFYDCRWGFTLLDQPPGVIEASGAYLSGRCFAIVPFLLFVACRAFLNGLGHTRPVMVIALVANLINAAADYLLIYGKLGCPAFGVLGAGIATSLVRWCMLAGIFYHLVQPRYRGYGVGFHRPEWMETARLVRLGLPVGAQMFAEVGVFSAAAVLAGWLGARAQAAHQIALSLASFTFMMPLGLSIAASVRVGQATGRQDREGADRAGRVALALGAALMSAAALVFVGAPTFLARLFSPEPDVLATARTLLLIAAVFQISDGVQIVSQGCLRGSGDTRTPLIANLVAHWAVGLPLGYVLGFPLGLGVAGIWLGLTSSLTLVAVVLASVFLRRRGAGVALV